MDNSLNLPPDATFKQQFNIKTGGIALYNPAGDIVDAVAWGKAPTLFTEETAALEMEAITSLERLPGGKQGNHIDTNNNHADFTLNNSPPQIMPV